jgi:DNA mismatch repair ATPase MutS
MNVFLMYPNRDLEPEQTLPPNAEALTQDLEINILFETMARRDKFLFKVAQQTVLSSLREPGSIRYRQQILQDCLRNPDVVRQIYQIPIQAIENKQRRWMGIFSHYPSGILSGGREMLIMFVDLLRTLKQIADQHAEEFESPGFRRFFSMIQQELDDDYFAVVVEHLKTLKFSSGVLLSAELGRGNEGTNYILRKTNHNDQNWIKRVISRKSTTYSYNLHPRDDHGARVLGELRDRGVNLVANAVAQSADHIDIFFKALRLELAFYIGCMNLSEKLAQLGEPIVFPQPAYPSERRLSFTSLYDVALALTMKQKVVDNDVNADNKDLMIITGANQGGKSVFLRSIGLAQVMMQCGMFVPAESFTSDIADRIFTHYKREEDVTMESGKFDEELSRMSDIVDNITPKSIVLFNESFAATNEREGSEIARQITHALLDMQIKVFYVTHLYELAKGFYGKRMKNAIFLRAERKVGGERTFKMNEGKPLQTSFGKDVYRKIFKKDRLSTTASPDTENILEQ